MCSSVHKKLITGLELLFMEIVAAIKTVNLTKRFGKRVAVDSLNLNIKQGELYCLLGDNGAGKTTTLNMLTTLLKPSSGDFFIGGFNGRSQSEECKGIFGVVSQDIAIYQELTAYENLAFIASLYRLPKEKSAARIKKLLVQAGLAERANDLVSTFSGGMQRRLTIAMALLHEPKVLFMDEPTVGLDPAARRSIWLVLGKLRQQGVTILLTTHYLEEAEILADRIGIIRKGKLVIEGTLVELRGKIQAIRKIAVRLGSHLPKAELEAKLVGARKLQNMKIGYDAVHNSLLFSKIKDSDNGIDSQQKLLQQLQETLDWLKNENIDFASFATDQPNLEDIFLTVTDQEKAIQ
jgi:ABC-2 type transport system ATP-binding protein